MCSEETDNVRRMVKSESFPLYVQYGMLVEKLVELGDYHWRTMYARWPYLRIGGSGIRQYEACRFYFGGGRIHESEARQRIEAEDRQRPWRPAGVGPLLTFGVQYPDEQIINPVVGLDAWITIPKAGEFNIYLHKKDYREPTTGVTRYRKALYLQDRALDWFPGTAFLAVRRAA